MAEADFNLGKAIKRATVMEALNKHTHTLNALPPLVVIPQQPIQAQLRREEKTSIHTQWSQGMLHMRECRAQRQRACLCACVCVCVCINCIYVCVCVCVCINCIYVCVCVCVYKLYICVCVLGVSVTQCS